ncbi:DUF2637 domain-containing protein [Leucobacter massiliensis]|uniref:Excisionase n=1 Tax=Leucobacter massiliensis TaxID=1686285 RepID=A0A2S9QLP6_9MICO|nr:DUF2637 domain-containing protein [Leucobacter massiliensis]PRI10520.1 hypothetical protein B4915_10970 [Leucobacter massiliensis]
MTAHSHRRAPRWLVSSAMILVLTVTLLAFGLSFAVLQDLAARAGIPAQMTWAWPLIVDGTIVTAMLVIFTQRDRGRRALALPWAALILFALFSVVGNGIHTAAVYDGAQGISLTVAICVGAIPPIGLLLASEMLVRLLTPVPVTATAVTSPDGVGDEVTRPVVDETVTAVEAETKVTATPVTDLVTDGQERFTPAPVTGVVTAPVTAEVTPDPVTTSPHDGAESPADEELTVLVEEIPTDPQEQISWIVERARAGQDVTRRGLMQALSDAGHAASESTVQRRLARARAVAPEAFAA